MSHPLSENDARVLIATMLTDNNCELDKRLQEYVTKAIFDAFKAQWEPILKGVRWLIVLIVSSFCLAFVGVVFRFLIVK